MQRILPPTYCRVLPTICDFIDPTGKIRTMQINDDQVGRSVEETLRLLKAFQFADSHEGIVLSFFNVESLATSDSVDLFVSL